MARRANYGYEKRLKEKKKAEKREKKREEKLARKEAEENGTAETVDVEEDPSIAPIDPADLGLE